jgi:thiamine biosynthesis lipoprotein
VTNERTVAFRFDAIGTGWEVATDEPLSSDVRERILQRTRTFDATYSRFRPDSLVSRIATAPSGGRFEFPEDSISLFALYDELSSATAGAVDPLVGRQLELLGYDATYSLTPAPAAVRDEEDARARPTWAIDVRREGRTLFTRRPLLIDVGAVGKGYLVDLVSTLLHAAGVERFVVDASGDLRHSGPRGIRVGLEHPLDARLVIGVAQVRDSALCASSTSRRAWGNGLHHLVDARSGTPSRQVLAAWAVAESAMLADGLATALFFTSGAELARHFRFGYVRMLADGRAEHSTDFDGELFT